MRTQPVVLYLACCLLPALAAAQTPPSKTPAEVKQVSGTLTARDVLGMAGAIGVLGALTVDATVGEAFVRAYPSKDIDVEDRGYIGGAIKLSCDTYRSASATHIVAAATACHIGYKLVASKSGFALSGPFRPPTSFEGRSCDEARKVCEAYQLTTTVSKNGKLVQLREKGKLLGTVDYSGQTPQYNVAK